MAYDPTFHPPKMYSSANMTEIARTSDDLEAGRHPPGLSDAAISYLSSTPLGHILILRCKNSKDVLAAVILSDSSASRLAPLFDNFSRVGWAWTLSRQYKSFDRFDTPLPIPISGHRDQSTQDWRAIPLLLTRFGVPVDIDTAVLRRYLGKSDVWMSAQIEKDGKLDIGAFQAVML